MSLLDGQSRMRFGLFMQPLHHPRENPTLALERDLQLLEHLDSLGFDEAWIGEHHSTGWETISSPEIFIAAAAARTRFIRLGTGIIPLAIHHPFHVVDRVILLDHLTRGRTMLGVGVGGGLPSDLYLFGVEEAQGHPRFQESFELIMRLLTTIEPITMKTDWFEIREALLQLRPYTHPYMPIAVASDHPTSLEMVGRYGAQVLSGAKPQAVPALFEHIQRGAAAAGRDAHRSQITLNVHMHLAETRQQALDQVRQGIAEEQFDFKAGVNGQPAPKMSRDEYVEYAAQHAIIGTPDDAIARIQHMLDVFGGFGGLLIGAKEWTSRAAIWNSYELFARYVMPHFQGSLAGLKASAKVASRFNHARQTQHA